VKNKIVVASYNTKKIDSALSSGIRLAIEHNCELSILWVIDIPYLDLSVKDQINNLLEESLSKANRAKEIHGFNLSYHIEYGDPYRVIIKYLKTDPTIKFLLMEGPSKQTTLFQKLLNDDLTLQIERIAQKNNYPVIISPCRTASSGKSL